MQELIKSTSTSTYLLKMVFTIKPHSEAGWEYDCLSRKTTQFSVWNGWSFPWSRHCHWSQIIFSFWSFCKNSFSYSLQFPGKRKINLNQGEFGLSFVLLPFCWGNWSTKIIISTFLYPKPALHWIKHCNPAALRATVCKYRPKSSFWGTSSKFEFRSFLAHR